MKKPLGKGSRRHLDDDEAAIWDHTAESVKPLKRAKGRVHASDFPEDLPARPRAKAAAHGASADLHAKELAKGSLANVAPAKKAPPPLADFDRKKAKHLRAGRIEIDARIDLHGMRQDEAHGALRAFLRRAQERGARWVLVITGKGRAASRGDDEPFDMSRNRDRGILKRNVPRWLEEPDLRPLIISFTTAAIGHGGEGALYVHLRKKG